jgi:[ribosomal protein S5]-alanine N-acetyltransferase
MILSLPQPIETARIRVRALDAADLEPLMAVNGDPEVTKFLPYKTWQSLDDAVAWYDRMRGYEAAGGTIQMVVARRADDVAIGTCLLFRHDEAARSAELGFVLGRSYWRTGIMGEAIGALLDHAFGPMGLQRLVAVVDPDNAASSGLLRRLGFVRDGSEETLDRYALTRRAA